MHGLLIPSGACPHFLSLPLGAVAPPPFWVKRLPPNGRASLLATRAPCTPLSFLEIGGLA